MTFIAYGGARPSAGLGHVCSCLFVRWWLTDPSGWPRDHGPTNVGAMVKIPQYSHRVRIVALIPKQTDKDIKNKTKNIMFHMSGVRCQVLGVRCQKRTETDISGQKRTQNRKGAFKMLSPFSYQLCDRLQTYRFTASDPYNSFLIFRKHFWLDCCGIPCLWRLKNQTFWLLNTKKFLKKPTTGRTF